jgi:starch-binding outer membrane protein, SusD/RagB family
MKVIMKKNKFIHLVFLVALVLVTFACKDQLQVGNPNSPTFSANVTDEAGLSALALGTIYINGFQNGDAWLGNSYFSINYGFMELMADNSGADAANQNISTMNVPDLVTVDDGTLIPTQGRAIPLERTYNTRASTGAGYNYVYYQWLNAYALNNGCNVLLAEIPTVKLSSSSKVGAFTALAYWWKGWAYAAVGSLYYSGLIVNGKQAGSSITPTNDNYVTHDVVIAESNKWYLKADSVAATIASPGDFVTVMGECIPPYFQTGLGSAPSVTDFRANIQSMLARNILVNKLNPFVNGVVNSTIGKSSTTTMAAADWNQVLTYATKGVGTSNNVFAGHSAAVNTVFTTPSGTVASMTAGPNASTTFKIGERYMASFHNGDAVGTDLRLAQNFTQTYDTTIKTPYLNINFGTRWALYRNVAGSMPPKTLTGVYQFANWNDGVYTCYIGTSYEENALMLAEANIMLGNIDAGLAFVDAVRAYQGAGVNAVSGTGLSQAQAMNELVMERRAALAFRGLAFYDARRWGWIYDVSNGGGVYKVPFLKVDGSLHTATINYNFLDYWDVPADEFVLNPPSSKGAAAINPNFQ